MYFVREKVACLKSPLLSALFVRELRSYTMPLHMFEDLLHPRAENEAKKHKLKRLVQGPNSNFLDVRCPGCYQMYVVQSSFISSVLILYVALPSFPTLRLLYHVPHVLLFSANQLEERLV